jgi:hypothetical protein
MVEICNDFLREEAAHTKTYISPFAPSHSLRE